MGSRDDDGQQQFVGGSFAEGARLRRGGGKRQGRRKCGGRGRVVLCTRQFYLGLGNFRGEVELIWDWQGLTRPLGFGKELAGLAAFRLF